MDRFRTEGIPMWVTIVLGLLVVLGSVAGLAALFGAGIDPDMTPSWGGRNLGLVLVGLAAILLKSPSAYIAAFVGATFREIGDIVNSVSGDEQSWPIAIFAAALIAVWIYGINAANKARTGTAAAQG